MPGPDLISVANAASEELSSLSGKKKRKVKHVSAEVFRLKNILQKKQKSSKMPLQLINRHLEVFPCTLLASKVDTGLQILDKLKHSYRLKHRSVFKYIYRTC